MNLTNEICRQAARYDAVAFDVFDTLIKRDTARPTGVFALRGEAFCAARTQAECEARAAKSGEVTLAEIYARPCLSGYDPAQECADELAACVPNPPVLAAVKRLKQQGKKLYYISDMYLPQTQIDAMLRRCGYTEFDGGLISCTYGMQKRSGKLFKQFLHETELSAKQVLFIGDSWRADVAGAALAGLCAWHLPTPTPPESDVQAFTQHHLPTAKTAGESLGFSVLGALAVAYCRWLHERRVQRSGAGLYFLARDMYLMRTVYVRLYPEEETRYLQVSRRSLAPAFLARGDWTSVLAALPRQQLTGAHAPRIYWAGQPMLERLLSQDVGATLGYAQAGDVVQVVTASHTLEPLLAQIQHGALQFAAAWQQSVLRGTAIPPQQAIALFLRLVESPTALQLKLLGNLTVEDGGTYPLAAPDSVGHYLTHPAEAKRDFAEARWKIGFLQRLAPLPLPYGKLYLKFKK